MRGMATGITACDWLGLEEVAAWERHCRQKESAMIPACLACLMQSVNSPVTALREKFSCERTFPAELLPGCSLTAFHKLSKQASAKMPSRHDPYSVRKASMQRIPYVPSLPVLPAFCWPLKRSA